MAEQEILEGVEGGYNFRRACKVRIHQEGTTSYGGGEHPDLSVTLTIEGEHPTGWKLGKNAAMGDVERNVSARDQLVLWHDEGGGGGRVTIVNRGKTNRAEFRQGGTAATFIVSEVR